MIIIPEKEIVLVTPPRTGSTSLWNQVSRSFPLAFRIYRHMEADGVPFGYDRWRRVGVFRDPIARLWSLYHYCRHIAFTDRGTPTWRAKLWLSVQPPFEEWLVDNMMVFADPLDSATMGYHPRYSVRNALPENRKSQFLYLRPDLGVDVLLLDEVMLLLDLDARSKLNSSDAPQHPDWGELGTVARNHLIAFHSWDLEHSRVRAAA